jgi:hypothetical protein
MWPEGKLSPAVIAQPPEQLAAAAEVEGEDAGRAEFLMVEETGVGPDHPFSGEKLSVVLTVYRYETFDEAVELIQRILDYQGAGHSCGIHTNEPEHTERLAHAIRVARVLENQSHCFANGGSFDNGLNFTLTMGCGTWAGNSISENLSYKHFLNVTRLVRRIPSTELVPSQDAIVRSYTWNLGTTLVTAAAFMVLVSPLSRDPVVATVPAFALAWIVGFTTHTGWVSAARDWDSPVEHRWVRPARVGSYERLFSGWDTEDFYLNLRGAVGGALPRHLLERAIGVVYRPESERASHYFHADLARQFDAVIHLNETTAVEPLSPERRWHEREAPETYPTGL